MSSCARRQLRIEAGTKREEKRVEEGCVGAGARKERRGRERKWSRRVHDRTRGGEGSLACVCVAIRELVKYIIPLDVSERWTARSRLYSISRVPSA